jgi:hypothetical protein
MESLSAGLYCDDKVQIFFCMALSVGGPGRLTLGLDMSCCEAERVRDPCPPRSERFDIRLRFSVTDAGRGAAQVEVTIRATPTSRGSETRIVVLLSSSFEQARRKDETLQRFGKIGPIKA